MGFEIADVDAPHALDDGVWAAMHGQEERRAEQHIEPLVDDFVGPDRSTNKHDVKQIARPIQAGDAVAFVGRTPSHHLAGIEAVDAPPWEHVAK